ncbi:WhiB family transcriptional regulator, partial [Streptomyces eurythermus]
MNLHVLDHIAEGRDALARAAKLASENSTLAQREATAIREAQAMKSEAIMGMHYRVRSHGCPACGCLTLMPKNGRAFCVNRHCSRGGIQRRWDYRELAFIGPGAPKSVHRTDTDAPPKDARPLKWLVNFFAQSGVPASEATLRRLIKTHELRRWYNPMDHRAHLYSLSDLATAHAAHLAPTRKGECTSPASRPPCSGLADLFFTTSQSPTIQGEAKKLCATCPLREACLDTAMADTGHSQHGIFGGLN